MECLICGCPSLQEEGPDCDPDHGALISKGSLLVFLLTQLLDVPSKELETLLIECGHPFTWTSMCDLCSLTLVEKGRDLVAKIRTLSNELSLLKESIKASLIVKSEEEFAISPKGDFRKRIRNLVIEPTNSFDEGKGLHHLAILGDGVSGHHEDEQGQEDVKTVEKSVITGYPACHDKDGDSHPEEYDNGDEDWKLNKGRNERDSLPQSDSSSHGKDAVSSSEKMIQEDSDDNFGGLNSPRKKRKMGDSGSKGNGRRIRFQKKVDSDCPKEKLSLCDICGIDFATKLTRDRHAKICSNGATTKNVKRRTKATRTPDSGSSKNEEDSDRLTDPKKRKKRARMKKKAETSHLSSSSPTSTFQDVLDMFEITIPEDGRLNVADEIRLTRSSKRRGISEFPCSKCSKVLGAFVLWRKHLRRCLGGAEGHTCPHCDFAANSLYRLDCHVFTYHFDRDDLKCQGCDKIFLPSNVPTYKEHIASLANDHTSPCVSSSIKCVEERCSYPFPTLKAYESHMLIRHQKETQKPFSCSLCPATFYQSNSLLSHTRKHEIKQSGRRDFVCEKCGTTFANKNGLKTHETRVHATEKTFICDNCGKAFVDIYRLKRHLRQLHEK